MGKGYSYACSCGKHYSVYPGSGMLYPDVYRKTIERIAAGRYGAEWKKAYLSTPHAAINADTVIYVCSDCGVWKADTDISLYAPNDPEIYRTPDGTETDEPPYVAEWELKTGYHLVKRYFLRCRRCGRRMHKASPAELENLPCPACGRKNRPACGIMWD